MGFLYLLYLAFILAGTLLLKTIMKVSFRGRLRPLIFSLFTVLLVFGAWDVLAVAAGHWRFWAEHVIGVWFLNQPLEELLFFLIVPFFYVVAWEALKQWRAAHA
ncbi:MAG: lycopene cyclase domain-containing protein [Candidatus Diapherotrites archaeon]|nr:lycopene cyclase domain-containing protein [Candidatus Diapherotrites archaeon]